MSLLLLSRRTFLLIGSLTPVARYLGTAAIDQKTVDKKNASEIGEYAIGFASKVSDGGYDHAFVIWYYSDPKGNQTIRRGAGFYPVANDNTKSYDMILGVAGKVLDDSKAKVSRELTVLINKVVFDKAIAVEDKYKIGETYHLGFKDCTTFVAEVAGSVPGLKLPSRATHIYPSSFVTALYDANSD